MVTVYLVPVGGGRYELYSEGAEEPGDASPPPGRAGRWLQSLRARWQHIVTTARREDARGLARWRAELISRTAEALAEQRTLWALRDAQQAALVYPTDLDEPGARRELETIVARARGHHRQWLIVDTIAFVASGLLMLIPGPNLVAYYFAFRLIGHYFSWRGAVQAADVIGWHPAPEAQLAELRTLAELPPAARAPRVEAIAASLNLPRLSAFFERTAAPIA
jgi:hypothetical protein